MTIYQAFKKASKLSDSTNFVKIYKCTFDGEEYCIIVTKRFATKNTIIHCIDDHVAWEQVPAVPRLAGRWSGERIPIYKFNDKSNIVFVVKGRPNVIVGLDEGVFRSANNFDKNNVNVMSYRRFKKLEL